MKEETERKQQKEENDRARQQSAVLLHAQASTTRLPPTDFAWHARMKPAALSVAGRPSSTSMVTAPCISLTLHVPQIPTRHDHGISTPTVSAASSTVLPAGRGA